VLAYIRMVLMFLAGSCHGDQVTHTAWWEAQDLGGI